MPIELTEQQQQRALGSPGEHLRQVVDPRAGATYILIPESEYEAVREAIEDRRVQRAIRATALRNAAGRMDEGP
ncbi:hypothetical protein [Tautonia plasticadhaerens]|uniref:Antitoxin n=1 Tax=Tautonia plasticadhaerens TaxID=2527974 RepID=A0A518H324_9BACT|nr:hypothetical protein [Tautonia plasticadhaerens]QDV35230.1 hypothetical protein ElP_31330 [Tautonia plasticadhaerens]